MLTLPAAALFGGAVYALCSVFGNGAAGPLVITVVLLIALMVIFGRRAQQAAAAPVTS